MAVSNEEIKAYLASNPGMNDAGIAAAMNQFKVSPDQMAQATGFGLGDVQSRYNAATTPTPYAGLNAQIAPEGIAAAYQQFAQPASATNTTTTPAFDARQGVFQTVYDPRTGQQFISPAQAFAAGVTDYVTSLPADLSAPTSLQGMDEKAIAGFAKEFGMTPDQFINAERQGAIQGGMQEQFRNTVADYSSLTPDELTSKLRAYQAKPPTTQQEFRDQQALYRNYADRYANSSYDYANMGGVAQDYSLQPKDFFPTQFTGYSDPLNKFLSGMQQNTPDFTTVQAQLTKNPAVAKAIEDIYKLDPQHQLFTGSGGNLKGAINRLSSEIDRIGQSKALSNFYKDQQNLVGFGGEDWFGGRSMGTPEYAELQRKIMSQTPVASDDKWQDMVSRTSGSREVEGIMRDPTSKLGVGLLLNEKTGRPDSLAYYDRDGRMLSASTFNKEDIYKNLEQYGFDLSNVGALGNLLKGRGVGDDLRGVEADLSEVATPEWLDKQIQHLDWQAGVAGDAGMPYSDMAREDRIAEIRRTNEMARRIFSGGADGSKAVDANTPESFLYEGLTESSTPEDIAAAYQQAIQVAGGDTAENQQRAIDYLTKTVGASEEDIAKSYGLFQAKEAADTENAFKFAYEYGQENDDFSGLIALLNKTPNPKELISKYNLTPEQINEIEFGTGVDLDQSGAFGAGQTKSDWDYGKYLSELKTGESDAGELKSLLDPLKTQNPILAKNAQNMFDEILRQQTVTGDNWSAGNLGSKEAAAMDFALRLAENNVGSIYDLGQRTVDVERYDSEMGGNYITQETEYYNKKTGEALPDWDRVASGNNSGSKLNYQINFAADGTPIPYTTPKRSDWVDFREGFVKPAISIVALANPALAPYIAAGNAINAADKGDWGSAIVSGLTAAVGFSGDLGLTASTVDTLNKAKTGAQILNAIDKGDPIAIANALSQTDTGKNLLKMDMGGGVTLGNVVDTAKIAASVNAGDYASALNYAGSLTKSPDLRVAGSSAALLNAMKSGDPFKIISAMGQLDKAVKTATKDSGKQAPVEDMKPTSYGTNITKQLTDVGLDEVNLPDGIQTASADGETPFRVEAAGAPIFADSPQAGSVRPPPGYRLMATTEEQEVQTGDKTRYVKPAGSYYDYTANAWFTPTSEFDAALDVKDYSALFGGDQANLTDADIAAIQGEGLGVGSNKSELGLDWDSMYQPPSRPGEANMGEMVITAPREPATDMGEMVITAPRDVPTDLGEMVITAPREPVLPDDKTPTEEVEYPEMVVTAPREPAAPARPTTPAKPDTPKAESPKVTPEQVAKTLGVPVSSPIVQDVIEALYGTMEYLDISEEFEPSKRKAKPAATQKQQQQTKMAQGGYLDNLLAENMSADDLLNLLR